MVDAGREYVERCASEHAALAAVLADGTVRLAAKRTARLWKRACEQRVAELRRSQALTAQMALSHGHRAATEITRAFITKARPARRRRVGKALTRARCASRTRSTRHSQHSSRSPWAACSAGRVRITCTKCLHLAR